MQSITHTNWLKNEIQLLEAEHTIKGQNLKEQFNLAYQSFKPVNILKGSLNKTGTSHYVINKLIGTATGLFAGYLSKKVFVGKSNNRFRKIIGSWLQFNITNIVSKHPDVIKSAGRIIIQYLLKKNLKTKNFD